MFPGRKRRLGTSVEAEHLEHFDLAILFLDDGEAKKKKRQLYKNKK
jgi:hypothetical protein